MFDFRSLLLMPDWFGSLLVLGIRLFIAFRAPLPSLGGFFVAILKYSSVATIHTHFTQRELLHPDVVRRKW